MADRKSVVRPAGGSRVRIPAPVYGGPTWGVGRIRKVALVGAAPTIDFTPWHDPSWEIWVHGTCFNLVGRIPDRYYDLHPWEWITGKGFYVRWLATQPVPIFMQRRLNEVPASRRYPKEQILAEHEERYFTSHAAWMIAHALMEGVTHLGFYGIHYAMDEEHKKQRAGCEYWMGVAKGRGVQLVRPPGCPLLREPGWLYGYESHTGKQHRRAQAGEKVQLLPPQNLTLSVIDPERIADTMRKDTPFKKPALDRLEAILSGQWEAYAQSERGHRAGLVEPDGVGHRGRPTEVAGGGPEGPDRRPRARDEAGPTAGE